TRSSPRQRSTTSSWPRAIDGTDEEAGEGPWAADAPRTKSLRAACPAPTRGGRALPAQLPTPSEASGEARGRRGLSRFPRPRSGRGRGPLQKLCPFDGRGEKQEGLTHGNDTIVACSMRARAPARLNSVAF